MTKSDTKDLAVETKLLEMVRTLKARGVNHGFVALQAAVVIVGPGSPFNVYPTWYSRSDLDDAVEAGLLEKRRLTGSGSGSGSFVWDTYAAK
jgi:hypothetical protein